MRLALGAGCGDGGGDGVDFFAPEHAAFACVGVEACYGDDGGAGGLIGCWCAGLCLELLRQEAVGDGDGLQQLLLRDGFYSLAQADSLLVAPTDSTTLAEDSIPKKQTGLDAPVSYQATDSIVMTAGNWA